jgi:hypothetical protein
MATIELADDVNQSVQEPVAWLYRDEGGVDQIAWSKASAKGCADPSNPTIYPLYAGKGQRDDE